MYYVHFIELVTDIKVFMTTENKTPSRADIDTGNRNMSWDGSRLR